MTTSTVDQGYVQKFPEELSKAVDGLGGDAERAVVIALFNEGNMAFSELQNELGEGEKLHQEKLSTALSSLKRGGLIRKKILEDENKTPFSSYYSLSEYGERFIYSLFESLGSLQGGGGRRQIIKDTSPYTNTLQESGEALAASLEEEIAKR